MRLLVLTLALLLWCGRIRAAVETPNTYFSAMTSSLFGTASMASLRRMEYDEGIIQAALSQFDKLFNCAPIHEPVWCRLVLDEAPFSYNRVTQFIMVNQFMTSILVAHKAADQCRAYSLAATRACHLSGNLNAVCRQTLYYARCKAVNPPDISTQTSSRDPLDSAFRKLTHLLPSLPWSGKRLTPG